MLMTPAHGELANNLNDEKEVVAKILEEDISEANARGIAPKLWVRWGEKKAK